ncbi:MAG: (2Fe-2S)-binding protein [Ktedonobacteraceae bacterium]|nr:(2Fe-2S)-binding protein [Ktedonobacteraceae bacterium]
MSDYTVYPIRFWLNEREMYVEVRATQTLLELLRDDLHQWDVKMSCGQGDCGSCTVLLNGETRLSCLTLAVQAHETRIATACGLGDQEQLHPLQEEFLRCGAVQCGFCTPGMLMTAKALLAQEPHPTRMQIRAAISGNLCRCTGYHAIVDAIEAASQNDRNTEKEDVR